MSLDQPVKYAARILAALTLLAGAWPGVADAFGWVTWTTEQLTAYIIGVNAVLGAAGLVFGVQVAKVVTPTNNPKDDAGNMLTPGTIGTDEADLPAI